MMKMHTRLLSLLLVMIILVTLCACGGGSSAAETSAEISTPSAAETPSTETAAAVAASTEEESETVAYPVMEEPTTFTFWFPESGPFGTYIDSWNENVVFEKMEELTNITFDFSSTPSSAASEAFSFMVASEAYTDLIYGFAQYYPESMDNAIDDDVILDLSDLAAQYAPDYYDYIVNEKEVSTLAMSDSGKLWGLHRVYEEQQLGISLMMRQDLLDDLDLDVPSTYAEMEESLLAITNKHMPDGAVLLNSTGFMDLFGGSYDLSAGYEIGTIDTPFINKDGTAVYTPATDGWHDYLEMMARWYEEGILNQNFNSMPGSDFFNRISTCDVAIVDFFFDQCANFKETAVDPNANVVGIPYPSVNAGDQMHLLCADPRLRIDMSVVISKSCNDPETLLQYFNYFWTDEGMTLANYGIEGEHYNLDDSGRPILTNSRKNDIAILDDVYTYRSGPILVLQDYFAQTLDEKSYDCLNAWTSNNDGSYVMPDITFTSDETYDLSGLEAELSTYVSEYTLKIICGQEDLDSSWDAYIANIEELNYEEIQSIYQTALDRFLSK